MEQKDLIQQGIIIATARKSNNMTQAQLAEFLHVEKQAVSNWEKGRNDLDPNIMQNVERILGIHLSEQSKSEWELYIEKIKDLKLVRDTSELIDQAEIVLEGVTLDTAYGATIRQIMTLLFYVAYGHHLTSFTRRLKRMPPMKAVPTSWAWVAEYMCGYVYKKHIDTEYQHPFSVFLEGECPSDEKLLFLALQKVIRFDKEQITNDDWACIKKEDESVQKWFNDSRRLGILSATELIDYGMIPEYNSEIGLSLRTAIYRFAHHCYKIDGAISKRDRLKIGAVKERSN